MDESPTINPLITPRHVRHRHLHLHIRHLRKRKTSSSSHPHNHTAPIQQPSIQGSNRRQKALLANRPNNSHHILHAPRPRTLITDSSPCINLNVNASTRFKTDTAQITAWGSQFSDNDSLFKLTDRGVALIGNFGKRVVGKGGNEWERDKRWE